MSLFTAIEWFNKSAIKGLLIVQSNYQLIQPFGKSSEIN